jgi:hypothetical protein
MSSFIRKTLRIFHVLHEFSSISRQLTDSLLYCFMITTTSSTHLVLFRTKEDKSILKFLESTDFFCNDSYVNKRETNLKGREPAACLVVVFSFLKVKSPKLRYNRCCGHFDTDPTFHFDTARDPDPAIWSSKDQLHLTGISIVLYFCTIWGSICKEFHLRSYL